MNTISKPGTQRKRYPDPKDTPTMSREQLDEFDKEREMNVRDVYSEIIKIVLILNKINNKIDSIAFARGIRDEDVKELSILITSLSQQGSNIGYYC